MNETVEMSKLRGEISILKEELQRIKIVAEQAMNETVEMSKLRGEISILGKRTGRIVLQICAFQSLYEALADLQSGRAWNYKK
jgi:hypothetical protein